MPYPFTGANANPWTYTPSQTVQQVPQSSYGIQNGNLNNIIWVANEQEASAFPVSTGGSVLMMDRNTNRFYIKTVTQNGVLLPMEVYEFNPIKKETTQQTDTSNYVTKDEFNELKKMLEDLTAPSKKG